MNVTFEKLTIHNFMSIVDLEFDFTSPDFRGINLVLGENLDFFKSDDEEDVGSNVVGSDSSNGSGKSTLFAALCFTLFGDSIKHTEANLIPNRTRDPKDPVSLDLFVGTDDKRYHIVRTLTGKSRKTTLTVTEILEDGQEKDVTLSTVKLTQSFICNKIIGCNLSVFLRTVLLRNDPSNNFFDLDKASKVKFIEELFDLGVFTEMYSEIHKDKLIQDRELYSLGQVKFSLEKNLADANEKFSSWVDDTDVVVAEKQKRLAEIKEIGKKKVEEHNAVKAGMDEQKAKLDAIEAKFPAQREKVNSLYRKISELKSQVSVHKSEIVHADKLMNTHHDTRAILCDDCRGKFDNLVHFGEIEASKKKAVDGIAEIEASVSDIQKQYDEENAKLSKGNDILAKKKKEFFAVQSQENSLRADIANLKREADAIKVFLEAPKAPKENPYGVMVEKAKSDIKENRKKMADCECTVRKLAVLEGVVSPDTIRNIVISGLINELNTRIKYYLQRMGATYTCVFDASLDYKFVTTTGETGYGNFSKGEEMRLAIATTFAFRDFMLVRINTRTNLLLVDEYLDSALDRLSKRGIMKMFAEFVAENKKMGVFLVSHDEYIKSMSFSSLLKFTKSGDVSTLEVDKT